MRAFSANLIFWTLIFGTLVFRSGPANADDTHYQDYPLGGRSVGLGGAFTALSDDPSGIYFNPAGIVDSTKSSVQISTTLYGFEISDTFFSAVERAADLDTVVTELNIIPTSGSFITTIGGNGPDGRPERAYGFGAFIPSYRSFSVRSVATIPVEEQFAGCDQLAYQRKVLDRSYYFGGSYAQRIDPLIRFGVSTFLTYRTLSDLEETSCFSSSASPNQPFATAQTNLDMGVASILMSLGLKVDLDPYWTVGINVTTPSIRVFDTANVRLTRGYADPVSGQTEFTVRELRGVEANTKVGTNLRLGVAYVVPRKLTYVADLVMHAPTKFRLFELPDDPDLQGSVTMVTNIERRITLNLATGLEYLMGKNFSMSGGLFTNFSSAPEVPGKKGERFDEARLPFVNAFGGSFVLGFFSEHTLTRAGVTLSYGNGSDVAPRFAGIGSFGRETEYVKIDVSQLFLFFFISSTFRY
jgi:long-chain fatty acid transport protein